MRVALLLPLAAGLTFAQTAVLSGVGNLPTATPSVTPGQLVSIFGTNLAAALSIANTVPLSTSLADDGIGSAPGDAFGPSYPDAIRFSFSCDTAMVREGSVKLREALL